MREEVNVIEGLKMVASGIAALAEGVKGVGKLRESGPYGIIHKSERIDYDGMHGSLIWDYIIWNELIFEDDETHKKYTLATNMDDKKMEEIFNDFVKRCKRE